MTRSLGTKTHILPGDPPIEVQLRRSSRARRFSLSVSRANGRVRLSLPVWAAEAEALAFLHDRESWLRSHVDAAPTEAWPMIGGTLPLLGADRPITASTGRSARYHDGTIHVPDDARLGARIKVLLQAMAREALSKSVTTHAASLGRPHGRITLRDTRSRWGSCTTAGDLMFSWRLIMAPPEILDYVAAHEVAHLVEMNHSYRFWALCTQLCPDTPAHRKWLKAHGPELLRWRFDAGGPEDWQKDC